MSDDGPPVCIACKRTSPPGGVELNSEYDWICKEYVACAKEIAKTILDTPSELPIGAYTTPERVAEAIDHDYAQRKARKK